LAAAAALLMPERYPVLDSPIQSRPGPVNPALDRG